MSENPAVDAVVAVLAASQDVTGGWDDQDFEVFAREILAAIFPSMDGLPDPTPGCCCGTCLLVRGIRLGVFGG